MTSADSNRLASVLGEPTKLQSVSDRRALRTAIDLDHSINLQEAWSNVAKRVALGRRGEGPTRLLSDCLAKSSGLDDGATDRVQLEKQTDRQEREPLKRPHRHEKMLEARRASRRTVGASDRTTPGEG